MLEEQRVAGRDDSGHPWVINMSQVVLNTEEWRSRTVKMAWPTELKS